MCELHFFLCYSWHFFRVFEFFSFNFNRAKYRTYRDWNTDGINCLIPSNQIAIASWEDVTTSTGFWLFLSSFLEKSLFVFNSISLFLEDFHWLQKRHKHISNRIGSNRIALHQCQWKVLFYTEPNTHSRNLIREVKKKSCEFKNRAIGNREWKIAVKAHLIGLFNVGAAVATLAHVENGHFSFVLSLSLNGSVFLCVLGNTIGTVLEIISSRF